MNIEAEEMIDIYGETYAISLKIPLIEAKCLSMGICSSEMESAVMDFLMLLDKNKPEVKTPIDN